MVSAQPSLHMLSPAHSLPTFTRSSFPIQRRSEQMGWLCCPLLLKCCQLLSCGGQILLGGPLRQQQRRSRQCSPCMSVWAHQCGKSDPLPQREGWTQAARQQVTGRQSLQNALDFLWLRVNQVSVVYESTGKTETQSWHR